MKIQLLKPGDHYSQLKSLDAPFGECNVTAGADFIRALGWDPWTGGYRLPDVINDIANGTIAHAWAKKNLPNYSGEPRELWSVLEWAINVCAAQERQICQFTANSTVWDLLTDVARGKPVIIGGQFTASGHFVCLTGLLAMEGPLIENNVLRKSSIICALIADPYGDYHIYDNDHAHYAPGHSGAECQFTVDELVQLLHPAGQEHNKRAIRAI